MRPLHALIIACAAVFTAHPALAGAGPAELAARRARVLAALDPTAAMVLRAPDERNRSGDTGYKYRTDSNLLYLTGEDRPGLTLVLAPRGVRVGDTTLQVVLFAKTETNDGVPPVPALADGMIRPPEELKAALETLLPSLQTLFTAPISPVFVSDWLNNRPLFLERDVRKELEKKFPQLKIKSPSLIVGRLRAVKSPVEVGQIRRSIAATGEGLGAAFRICRPGMKEYELQAAIEYPMYRNGATAPAFSSIVGSGPNSLILHYEHNQRTMQAGDVVVMDVGAEIEGYAADITRTIPVSGKFTPEQRKVYETVLRAQEAIIKAIRPGALWSDMDRAAKAVIDAAGYGKYWRHSVSHHLGIDVHDAGPMDTLRVGMVVTMEPGVYIPVADTTVASGFRGVGIRIEDDALVTETGCEVLTAAVPKQPADIERIMKKK
ncbi:MAG: aminopeptidase P family protein [Ignavibacteriae bacterium]|nr:aminopeptidase P family protein [Ignavibacteriota bacterium]